MPADSPGIPGLPVAPAPAPRPQFRLTALLLLTLGAALAAGLLFAAPSRVECHVLCERLPPDDGALLAWLAAQQGVRKPRVARSQRLVQVEYYLLGPLWRSFDALKPPWREFGYVPKRVSLRVTRPALDYYFDRLEQLGLPLAVFAMLLIYLLRRRAALRRSSGYAVPTPRNQEDSDRG